MNKKTVMIALGGNALSPKDEAGTIQEQFKHTRESLKAVLHFVKANYNICMMFTIVNCNLRITMYNLWSCAFYPVHTTFPVSIVLSGCTCYDYPALAFPLGTIFYSSILMSERKVNISAKS